MGPLILASASPARRRLLREAGFRFRMVPSHVSERRQGSLRSTVLHNARRKAESVATEFPDACVLAADTMIGFGGRLYGKPAGRRAALELLCRLSGRTHTLATGVVILKPGRRIEKVVISRVTFRAVSIGAIRALLRRRDATRYAGGYAIRRVKDPLVERVSGSFTNVVGLPMEWVGRQLEPLRGR